MKKVLIGGVFDILHPGHLWVINQAHKHGEYVVVVVARDTVAQKLKGRLPIVPETQRKEMVSGLKGVDEAVLGDPSDFTKTVDKVKPQVVVLGFDQKLDDKVASYLKDKGIKLVKLNDRKEGELFNSSKIVLRLRRG